MLRLVAYDGEGTPIFMFGLSQENVARLLEDQPIDVDLSTMDENTTGRLVIFTGKDEHDMMNQVRPMIGRDTRVHIDDKFGEEPEEDDPRAG